ncbi:MAG TPA: DNA-3-methyladenine glycosylase [Steroidobacteraceae bacterium]|nr:DNA-3-methyladenine glycosylase [Steroidobacteraceae bacterium]
MRAPPALRIEAPAAPASPLRGLRPLDRAALPKDTVALARFLLGKIVVREAGKRVLGGRIVETEAYLEADPACHAFRGMTARNRSLFLEAGHAYVYLCYGTSYMLNVCSEAPGIGAGVLLRALEPLSGIEHMQRARGVSVLRDLARGPGRLAAALGVDLKDDGLDLCRRGGLWIADDGASIGAIGESVRIGLTKGAEARLRYFVLGSGYLSGSRSLNGSRHRLTARGGQS